MRWSRLEMISDGRGTRPSRQSRQSSFSISISISIGISSKQSQHIDPLHSAQLIDLSSILETNFAPLRRRLARNRRKLSTTIDVSTNKNRFTSTDGRRGFTFSIPSLFICSCDLNGHFCLTLTPFSRTECVGVCCRLLLLLFCCFLDSVRPFVRATDELPRPSAVYSSND